MASRLESWSSEADQVEHTTDSTEVNNLERRISEARPASDRTPLNEFQDVEIARIDTGDIQSAADFKSSEQYTSMCSEAQRLEQVRPALEKGADVETMHTWDEAHQIGQYSPEGHTRGYADAYHSYYGTDCVALESRPDGSYGVVNGRHRIVAARDAGLSTIPAKVDV